MNIVKLEHEQQTAVITAAVKTLRETIVGNIGRIQDIDEGFLALRQEDVGIEFPEVQPHHTRSEREDFILHGAPLELPVISVSRAIEKAIRDLMAIDRPHIEQPVVSEIVLSSLGEKVIQIFNAPQKDRIILPIRWARAVVQRIEEKESEIRSSEERMLQFLRQYFQEEHGLTKEELFEHIDETGASLHDLNKENREDDSQYDLSAFYEENEGKYSEDDTEKFAPGDIFSTDGGLDMRAPHPDDPEFRIEMEEAMRLSEAERELRCFLPHGINNDPRIVQTEYCWHIYGEEWQRETFIMRESAPKDYITMLKKMLLRKLTIYTYAEQRLTQKKGKKGGIIAGDYLLDLKEEIEILENQIDEFEHQILVSTKKQTNIKDVKSSLEKSFKDLRNRYRRNLKYFLDSDNTADVQEIETSLTRAYRDLESYCLKHALKSTVLGSDINMSENGEVPADVITMDKYLEHPNYFLTFPEALFAPKSESEKILTQICHIDANPILVYDSGEYPIEFCYRENDGTESPVVEKMKLLEEHISLIIERKMSLYFHATQWLEINESEEIAYYKSVLENEIRTMEKSLIMMTRRIRWEIDPRQRCIELQSEIDSLSEDRYHLLEKFVGSNDSRSRLQLEGKILELCGALELRNQQLSDFRGMATKSNSSIPTLPLSPSEVGLCTYIPSKLRKSETILFGRQIPYSPDKSNLPTKKGGGVQGTQFCHLLERKMMTYFFATKKAYEIDAQLIDTDCSDNEGLLKKERLMKEGDFISEDSHELLKEIRDLVETLLSVNSTEPLSKQGNQSVQSLCDRVVALNAVLDGLIANSDSVHEKNIEHYWFTFQRYILRFKHRIINAETQGELTKIPHIQAEFYHEMGFILLDIQTFIISQKIPKRNGQKLMHTAETIRADLFSKKENH